MPATPMGFASPAEVFPSPSAVASLDAPTDGEIRRTPVGGEPDRRPDPLLGGPLQGAPPLVGALRAHLQSAPRHPAPKRQATRDTRNKAQTARPLMGFLRLPSSDPRRGAFRAAVGGCPSECCSSSGWPRPERHGRPSWGSSPRRQSRPPRGSRLRRAPTSEPGVWVDLGTSWHVSAPPGSSSAPSLTLTASPLPKREWCGSQGPACR
jgi:hypothetical protein